MIIARVVISMGIYGELSGLYAIVSTEARVTGIVPNRVQSLRAGHDNFGHLQPGGVYPHELVPGAMVNLWYHLAGRIGSSSPPCCSSPSAPRPWLSTPASAETRASRLISTLVSQWLQPGDSHFFDMVILPLLRIHGDQLRPRVLDSVVRQQRGTVAVLRTLHLRDVRGRAPPLHLLLL